MPYDLDAPEQVQAPIVQSVNLNQYRLREVDICFTSTDTVYKVTIVKGVESGGSFTEHQAEVITLAESTTPELTTELDLAPTEATKRAVIEDHVWNVLENAGLVPAGSPD